jgi:hypothetical protein
MDERKREIVRNFYHLQKDKGDKKARVFCSNDEYAGEYIYWLEKELAFCILQENDWNKWITPARYKKITGKDYPDDGPVWSFYEVYNKKYWLLEEYGDYKQQTINVAIYCVIANHYGKPLDFIPEETK